ncbi:hypothetical protein XENOCAPTIV_024674 [Xenoophorus captivus]|uniref:Uncharacterized protein n=1 Tax=Xenoophorus captivus TaxID=1517983 RepID=A0ABV0RS03_9TELE
MLHLKRCIHGETTSIAQLTCLPDHCLTSSAQPHTWLCVSVSLGTAYIGGIFQYLCGVSFHIGFSSTWRCPQIGQRQVLRRGHRRLREASRSPAGMSSLSRGLKVLTQRCLKLALPRQRRTTTGACLSETVLYWNAGAVT